MDNHFTLIIVLIAFITSLFFVLKYLRKEVPKIGGDNRMFGEDWEAHKHRTVQTLLLIVTLFITLLILVFTL